MIAREALERVADLFATHPFRPDEVLVARDFGDTVVAAIVVSSESARARARNAGARWIARRLRKRAPAGHVYLVSFDLAGRAALDLVELDPRPNASGGTA